MFPSLIDTENRPMVLLTRLIPNYANLSNGNVSISICNVKQKIIINVNHRSQAATVHYVAIWLNANTAGHQQACLGEDIG